MGGKSLCLLPILRDAAERLLRMRSILNTLDFVITLKRHRGAAF